MASEASAGSATLGSHVSARPIGSSVFGSPKRCSVPRGSRAKSDLRMK